MEILKKHRTGVRLFLPVFVLCFAIAAIALLFAAKPVTSASAEEESLTTFCTYTTIYDSSLGYSQDFITSPGFADEWQIENGVLTVPEYYAGVIVEFVEGHRTDYEEFYPTAVYIANPEDRNNGYTVDLFDLYNTGTFIKDQEYSACIRSPGTGVFACKILHFTISESLPLPETPTKEGHTFTGWYLDEDCTQPYDGRPITEDMQLYAGWEINTYTVSFNSNGGEAVEALTVDWNSTPELPTPTREGHTFLGWFDGDSAYNNAPITADKTLTAHWQINTYTVTFMSDGEVYKEVVVEWGTSFQTVMNANGMAYFNLLTTEGAKMSKGTPVKSDMTVAVEKMTGQEKAAEFFAQNWWVLIVAGVALVIVTAIIVSAVKGKRR